MRSLQALDFESCRLGFNQNGYANITKMVSRGTLPTEIP